MADRTLLIERLFRKRKIIEATGCWEFDGARTVYGYGKLRVEKQYYDAHRLSYTLFVGEIPEGMFVCHKCDNAPCFNPDHLFSGTSRDNMRDCLRKERSRKKLTAEIAEQIRIQYAAGGTTTGPAKRFGISRRLVKLIVLGRCWPEAAGPIQLRMRDYRGREIPHSMKTRKYP